MDEQIIKKVHLDAWEWLGAVAQKITMARLRVIDHREPIPEEELPLFKFLFAGHRNGVFPIYENKMEGIVESVSQNTLFSEDLSHKVVAKHNGTDVDLPCSETNKE